VVDSGEELERGREFYAGRAWADAHRALTGADATVPLGAEDLELYATSAFMVGREEEYLGLLERTHQVYLDRDETLRAARCALWVGLQLAAAGEMGRAGGWLGRAQRLVDREGRECVEQGYLLLPLLFEHEAAGRFADGAAVAGEAVAVSERYGDADLFGLAGHTQGHLLIKEGRIAEGLALLDESMVAVTSGEMSPIVSGIVYCGVILGCQDAYDLGRAREWTAALTKWCDEQPQLVAYSGRCLVHRAEILQFQGSWAQALEEARLAVVRCEEGNNRRAAGGASYLEGEVHRLKGEFEAAEKAYREASRRGWEPQPGLALLRLAQGKDDAAAAAIRRVAGETTEPFERAALLPAYVEIMLEVGDLPEARSACAELEEIARRYGSDLLNARVAQARGAVEMAEGDVRAALVALRQASQTWQQLGAPYDGGRARWLVGLACSALGDEEAAALELEAARDAFTELGAEPDLSRIEPGAPADAHGLTPRELEVLRLVAAGKTNKAIAADLVLSERTVDRHVSNIFTKLRVSSRAAATAFAYEHELV
jgi:DNA-binding CsgD family transcriptional regulator